jgi:hypothetical protein
MEGLWIVTMLAALQFFFFAAFAGSARAKAGVKAPAITGDETFERRLRVQYNTMEQLVIFYPGLWAFGTFVNPSVAALLGGVYILGRIFYFVAYTNDPDSRSIGFGLTILPNGILLIGGLIGAIWEALV